MEPADIARPPRQPREPHIQAGAQLAAEGGPATRHIPAPDERAEALRPGPRAAEEIDDLGLAGGGLAVEESPGVLKRVDVSDLEDGPGGVAVGVEVVDVVFGLCFVEPEDFDAVVEVVVFDGIPHEGAGGGGGEVGVDRVTHEGHGGADAAVGADQVSGFEHGGVVGGALVDGRPDRDHELDVHGLQLRDHGGGVGPVDGVELPFALERPVEEIGDDDVEGEVARAVFPRDVQELVLGLVP